MNRFLINGIPIFSGTYDGALDEITALLSRHGKGTVNVTSAHGIVESKDDPALYKTYQTSFLNTPDGMPLVVLGRLLGKRETHRVYGPTLMLKALERFQGQPYRHFFFGGDNEILLQELLKTLKVRFPKLEIAGSLCPPFFSLPVPEAMTRELATQIKNSKANVIWIGLGCPKQELLMDQLIPQLPEGVLVGVGAAFNYHIGRISAPPGWIQNLSLEWLYRLIQEPRRLWRRYLKIVPGFFYLGLREWIRNLRGMQNS